MIPHYDIKKLPGLAPRKLLLPYSTWLYASQTLRMFGYDPYNSATAADIYRAVTYGNPRAT